MNLSDVEQRIVEDIIDSSILPYFRNYVGREGLVKITPKYWSKGNFGTIFNAVTLSDGQNEGDVEITVGMSRGYDGYVITIDGEQYFFETDSSTLGQMYDNLGEDMKNLTDFINDTIEEVYDDLIDTEKDILF